MVGPVGSKPIISPRAIDQPSASGVAGTEAAAKPDKKGKTSAPGTPSAPTDKSTTAKEPPKESKVPGSAASAPASMDRPAKKKNILEGDLGPRKNEFPSFADGLKTIPKPDEKPIPIGTDSVKPSKSKAPPTDMGTYTPKGPELPPEPKKETKPKK